MDGFKNFKIVISVHSEEVLKKIIAKGKAENFSNAIEYLCANYERNDKNAISGK